MARIREEVGPDPIPSCDEATGLQVEISASPPPNKTLRPKDYRTGSAPPVLQGCPRAA